MSRVSAKSERVIDANPEDVYNVLTDYRNKRPQMLTTNFLDYDVERGGRGAGTVVTYRLRAARRERPYRMVVEEPMKGRVITERDKDSSLVTTWTLSPVKNGHKTNVLVTSEWEGAGGIGGFFERTFAPIGLHRIYSNMLTLLSLLVQGNDISKAVSREEKEQEGGTASSNALVFLTLVGLVVGFAWLVRYIMGRQKPITE